MGGSNAGHQGAWPGGSQRGGGDSAPSEQPHDDHVATAAAGGRAGGRAEHHAGSPGDGAGQSVRALALVQQADKAV